MELKEAILSTLAELQEGGEQTNEIEKEKTPSNKTEETDSKKQNTQKEPPKTYLRNIPEVDLNAHEMLEAMIKKDPPLMPMAQENVAQITEENGEKTAQTAPKENLHENDRKFLEGLRERILVMFEGMQSPNNRATEAKIDLILNFFEWQLTLIDERLEGKK